MKSSTEISEKVLNDEALVLRLRNGDRNAFNAIYKNYEVKLYLYAFSVLKDVDLSKDIVQEVMVQLWIRKKESNIQSLRSYLFQAVRFRVLTAIKACNKKVVLDECALEEIGGTEEAEDRLAKQEISNLLRKGIAELPKKCREAFVLSRQQYLSNKEIAEKMGVAVKTVENQMTIALRRLKIALEDYLP
ncbi:RNA polymerase sigma factor [Parapedobacter deserti]|uniref:RNA polymerase sigma factor n=1 Tax=Parapedobacter deserti TaxID=1912957 RepID=A0ABV7JI98_9SPHI